MPAGAEPALPAFGAAQRLDGLLDEGAVGGAALLALGVGQLAALGHHWCSSREAGVVPGAGVAPGSGWFQRAALVSSSSWRRWAMTAGQPACWECST